MAMKNAKTYEKKVRTLLAGICKERPVAEDPQRDVTEVLVDSMLQEDATPKQAQRAMAGIKEEFVDFNELRVAPVKEIVGCMGKGFPEASRKAHMLTVALGRLFSGRGNVSLEHLASLSKRDVRRHLIELGLSPYAAASVTLQAFGGHAVPVDETLVECLKMEQYVHPEASLADVQGFLERIVGQKDARSVHRGLRAYVAGRFKALNKKRRAQEAAARARAEKERQEQAAREKTAKKQAATRKKLARAKKVKKAARTRKAARAPGAAKPAKKALSGSRSRKTTSRRTGGSRKK